VGAEYENKMGLANYYLKKYPESIKNFSQAIERCGADPIYYVNRSKAYRKMENYKEAYGDLKKSNKICLNGKFHENMPLKNQLYIKKALEDIISIETNHEEIERQFRPCSSKLENDSFNFKMGLENNSSNNNNFINNNYNQENKILHNNSSNN
jgi:tetratricopeptide (TPR) repeat protein